VRNDDSPELHLTYAIVIQVERLTVLHPLKSVENVKYE
jgi:hypothetical protein